MTIICVGITGGFAPPTPNAVHILTRTVDTPDKVAVISQTRPDGEPSLSPAQIKSLDVNTKETEGLVDELHKILEVGVAAVDFFLFQLDICQVC